jgi:hypothetical protein
MIWDVYCLYTSDKVDNVIPRRRPRDPHLSIRWIPRSSRGMTNRVFQLFKLMKYTSDKLRVDNVIPNLFGKSRPSGHNCPKFCSLSLIGVSTIHDVIPAYAGMTLTALYIIPPIRLIPYLSELRTVVN